MDFNITLKVENAETGELLFQECFFSVEALEEKLYKVERAIKEAEENEQNLR